jgi:serine/threonine-protein kinase
MVALNTTDLSGRQIGNYELIALLKRRAATDLYEARDIKLDQPVLVEILRTHLKEDPDLAGRFQRRMETVSQIKHPYIDSVIEISVTDDGYPYAVLEYVSGVWMDEALTQRRAKGNTLPPVRDALAFGRSIAEALSVAHSAGLIHHDLRPSNILIRDSDGMPVLMDLGVPLVTGSRNGVLADSRTTTLDYAAPEELDGKSISRRSNIYSLGIILYELLTGHRPELPSSSWDIFEHSTMPKEVPLEEAREGLSGETYRLVRNCLWRQEWSRFETADEVISAIDTAILAEETVPKAAIWSDNRRRWMYITIPVVALLMLILGLALVWSQFASAGGEQPTAVPVIVAPTEPAPQEVALGVATEVLDPTATTEPTPTLTREAPPTSALDATVPVYGPGADQTFNEGDIIDFAWIWLSQLEPDEAFSVYVVPEDVPGEPVLAGTVAEPDNATLFRLDTTAVDLGLASGAYLWQVRLENLDSGETLVESDSRRFFIAEPPTPTSSATTVLPTLTLTATATATLPPPSSSPVAATPVSCVPQQPPGWVAYRIKFGDALSVFAQMANVPVETILEANCLARNSVLSVNQLVYIPVPPATATSTPRPTFTAAPPSAGSPGGGGTVGGGGDTGGSGGGGSSQPTSQPVEGPTSTPKPADG